MYRRIHNTGTGSRVFGDLSRTLVNETCMGLILVNTSVHRLCEQRDD